jgi:hypothetical protein
MARRYCFNRALKVERNKQVFGEMIQGAERHYSQRFLGAHY